MKLTFAGVGSAFCGPDQYQTMAVLEQDDERLLIDCGGDARFALAEIGLGFQDIGSVYISHLHGDHIGGLEWLAFGSHFVPECKKPGLVGNERLLWTGWSNSLRGGLQSIEGREMSLEDYFNVQGIELNGYFLHTNKVRLTPVQTVHVMSAYAIVHSYGLLIDHTVAVDGQYGSKKAFYTADTQFCPTQIKVFYEQSDIIFQDCETAPYYSGVHAHYDDLKTLPEETRAKMWLMHYQPCDNDAEADGFAGFIQKGQVFEL